MGDENMNRVQENLGDRLLREEAERAFESYGLRRPRAWLAKYGSLASVSSMRKECQALIKPREVSGNDDYMPHGIINLTI